MSYTVNIAKLGGWASGLIDTRKERVVQTIRRVVYVAGQQIVQEEIDNTKPHKPVDRGDYRRGWRYTEIKDGARLYNGDPKASIIEYGRRPGTMPPVGVLARWVMRKAVFGVADESAAYGIAMAIALKHMVEGTPGMRVLKRTMDRLIPIVNKAADRTMAGAE